MASYYIDKTGGNDNNNGSYNSPWKTLLKANTVGYFLPDDTLFLKRGEVWTNENLIIYNDYFTVDCYGDAEEKPIIRPCIESLNDSEWVHYGNNIYVMAAEEPASGLFSPELFTCCAAQAGDITRIMKCKQQAFISQRCRNIRSGTTAYSVCLCGPG